MRSQALGMEVERQKLLLIRVVTVDTVWIGKCVLRVVTVDTVWIGKCVSRVVTVDTVWIGKCVLRVVTVDTVWRGKCVLRAVKVACPSIPPKKWYWLISSDAVTVCVD